MSEFDFRFSFHLSSFSSQVRDVAAVTSDNANDITKTINDAGFHRGACLCHELDLSVQVLSFFICFFHAGGAG